MRAGYPEQPERASRRFQRPHKPELIQCGGAHRVDQLADLADGGRGLGAHRAEHLLGGHRVAAQAVSSGIGHEGDPRQPRTQAVVEIAA